MTSPDSSLEEKPDLGFVADPCAASARATSGGVGGETSPPDQCAVAARGIAVPHASGVPFFVEELRSSGLEAPSRHGGPDDGDLLAELTFAARHAIGGAGRALVRRPAALVPGAKLADAMGWLPLRKLVARGTFDAGDGPVPCAVAWIADDHDRSLEAILLEGLADVPLADTVSPLVTAPRQRRWRGVVTRDGASVSARGATLSFGPLTFVAGERVVFVPLDPHGPPREVERDTRIDVETGQALWVAAVHSLDMPASGEQVWSRCVVVALIEPGTEPLSSVFNAALARLMWRDVSVEDV